MFDLPLHPVVVHLPMALSVLLPLLSLVGLVLLWREDAGWRAWLSVPLLAAVLTASSFVALETGEQDEDVVESVVAESAIEAHEEAAERFAWSTGVLLLLAVAGLAPRRHGTRLALAGATVVASIGVLALGVDVGHKGGELVYRHGAASAHVAAGGGAATVPAARTHDDD